MHPSVKTHRFNKINNRSNQIMQLRKSDIQLSYGPNMLHPGHVQNDHKYKNNFGSSNEVEDHRSLKMHIENNQDVYKSRNQFQQHFIYKIPQHIHLKSNAQQKYQINHLLQRKVQKPNPSAKFLINVQQTNQNFAFNEKHYSTSINKAQVAKELLNDADVIKSLNNNSVDNKALGCYENMEVKSREIQIKNEEEYKTCKNNTVSTLSSFNIKTKSCESSIATAVHQENSILPNVATEEESNIEQEVDCKHKHSDKENFEEEKFGKNSRDKTPMCLVNDLARFNKISFQYRLTSENGPAHCKRFSVTLKLGDEEYTADGFKIKQAQHFAAKEAIEKTKYKHPTPKINRRIDNVCITKSNITPTVELNALAMKLGQQTYYIFDPKQITENKFTQNDALKTNNRLTSKSFETNKALQQSNVTDGNFECSFTPNITNNRKQGHAKNHSSKCQNQFSNIRNISYPILNSEVSTHFPASFPCKITLIVGTKEFIGFGRTIQQAKHNAASNALLVLKEQIHEEPKEIYKEDNDNKSPISLVFEIGIKRNLAVDFKVIREEGPAHMRTFITACIVGDIITEGEGTGKKNSKKKAAQKMLDELNKLPPVEAIAIPLKRVKLKSSSKKQLVTSQPTVINVSELNKTNPECNTIKKQISDADSFNPVTKLLEWHQNKKEKEPIFKLITEFGKENSRRRQFIMEVTSNNISARGVGYSKKLAKRNAAQNLLTAINEGDKIVSTIETGNITNAVNFNIYSKKMKNNQKIKGPDKLSNIEMDEAINNLDLNTKSCKDQETAKITGYGSNGNFCTTGSKSTNISSKNLNLHMKDQLLYLAKLLGFEVDFSDYPKGSHNEYLTIVMLSTNPPQICHGVGINSEESQEDAAKNALKILSEMGLNNVVKT